MIALVAAGMVVTVAARAPQGTTRFDLLITRARVVDTRSGAITPGRIIAIRGDTIVAIGGFRRRLALCDAPGRSSMLRDVTSFPDCGTCTCTSAAATR